VELATFRALLTGTGQAALAAAEGLLREGATDLAALTRLRARFPVPLAAAAFEQATLRRRALAGGKFARAAEMYFSRDGLEQATGEAVARYRARRYAPFGIVADLACGIGGDALALAAGHPVLAVDRDPLRLALARENARVYDVASRLLPVCADLLTLPTPRADAIFCDPGRRTAEGRRIFAPGEYQPPLPVVASWRAAVPALGVKVSPGIDREHFPPPGDAEVEFISEGGTLKEAVFWYGPLRTVARRATVLPGGATMTADEGVSDIPIVPPHAILYEPDPAVIRAGLVEHLARDLGAAKIDREIAYLTAERAETTPFARAYRVIESFPFGLKRLKARLRALDAGIVTVKKRGSPLDTDTLARQLRGDGARPLTVVLTHVLGKPYALVAEVRSIDDAV
jgi:SAM-dependent methyltransferase